MAKFEKVFNVAGLTFLAIFAQACFPQVTEPFTQSTERCLAYSSLECTWILSDKAFEHQEQRLDKNDESYEETYAFLSVMHRPGNLKEFLASEIGGDSYISDRGFQRIRYLNGWSQDVLPEIEVPALRDKIIYIAVDGFLPEEFDSQPIHYTFAEKKCKEQIVNGEKNDALCESASLAALTYISGKEDIGTFLKGFNPNKLTLEEFVRLNELPESTTLSSRVVDNRYYNFGSRINYFSRREKIIGNN